ncbi:TonB-dependent receptor domain-containing protein [Caulobacter sp. NIBR2454]|uniref:TonB-dependent receptor domain-containing protein n=1 Tax=Caulobacter sp. NIBR2454 TaxID=3015996 RepID=UPI0022B62D1C|nr:TonB-dependent receptor [Caulobacter sp. NIBR2454]
MSRTFLFLGVALGAVLATQAMAQTDERAVQRAADAFGMRVGVEQIGLYSETQVRGFNLQDAGNFRLGEAYYVRSANLVDTVLAGVVTRVGINALDSDFAAPSGVVDYRLRSPFEAPTLNMEIARREYGGEFYELGGSTKSADGSLAALAGFQANLFVSSTGVSSRHHRYGTVGEWRFSDTGRVRAFASLADFNLQGVYGISPTAAALPPRLVHPRRYVPSWGDHDGQDLNAGVIASGQLADDLDVTGSVIHSRLDLDKADFALLSVDENGVGRATGVTNRPRDAHSWAGAVGASWRHAPGRRLYAEMRGRRTVNKFSPSVSLDLGPFDQAEGLRPSAQPILTNVPRTQDEIEQFTAGLGYEATFDQLRLKGGVSKTLHERTIAAPGRPAQSASEQPWLYEASAVYAVNPQWTVFASATRGLEESGAAPNNAANANEVLPAAIATQQELGVRGRLSDQLTLIGSLFSIEKSAPGFDTSNVYRLIGTLRHRGVEMSLTGRLTRDLRIVAGAAYLQAERAGEPVDTGVWSKEAVGIPKVQAMTGLTYAVPAVPGLSLDGQVAYYSDRRARSQGSLRTPAFGTMDLGMLYAFRYAGKDMALRARLLNVFDTDVWVASRSELLDRPNRRGARISLTLRY